MYGLWNGYLFGDGRRKRGVDMFGLSGELEFGSVEFSNCRLFL